MYENRLIRVEAPLFHLVHLCCLFGGRICRFLALPLLCWQCEGQVEWNLNFEFLLTGVSGESGLVSEWASAKGTEWAKGSSGIEGGSDLRRRNTYVHGNVPGHVDVRFVFIHPHLGSPQSIALSVVIYVIVVGLLGALDVSHSGTWEDFHTTATLPHLQRSKEQSPCVECGFKQEQTFFYQ